MAQDLLPNLSEFELGDNLLYQFVYWDIAQPDKNHSYEYYTYIPKIGKYKLKTI